MCMFQTLASGYKHNRKEFAKQSLSGQGDGNTHSAHEVHHEVSEADMLSDSLFNPNMVRTHKALSFCGVEHA